jgi:NAD(P) transhydrogenase subunit beta
MPMVISHLTISATTLMATSLGMSGLAMVIPFVATSLFVASLRMTGTSLMMSAARVLVGLLLSKIWMVSLLSMLALYNGIGGGTAGVIAMAEMFGDKIGGASRFVEALIVALIGAVALSGSLVACLKINGLIEGPSRRWGRRALNLAVAAIVLAVGGYIALTAYGGADRSIASPELIYGLLGGAVLLGVSITLPFRLSQMPMLVSLYNAFTVLAIGLEGLLLRNAALAIAGIVIGAARAFFTLLMVEQWPEPKSWRVLWSASAGERFG